MKLLWRGQCRAPRLCTLLPFTSATERNVFGHTSFCRAGLNRIERLNDEIKRRTEMVGLFQTKAPSFAWSVQS